MDWSGWMRMNEAEQDALRAAYRKQLSEERDKNREHWDRMTREQKARYPEARGHG